MSRGFGATFGVATTDKISTALETQAAQRTFHIWAFRNGNGGGNIGRMFDSAASVSMLLYNSTNNAYQYRREWSVSEGDWDFPAPATGGWHSVGVVIDSSSTPNDPLMYLGGVSQTVTERATPNGTVTATEGVHVIGNTAAGTRNWDGLLAEFAVWDALLTQDDMTSLAGGASPLSIPANLVEYIQIVGTTTPISHVLTAPTPTGTLGSNNDPPTMNTTRSIATPIGVGLFIG